MFKNYLKVALRNLRHHKIHSIITIGGLAASMSLSLLIILFVKEQLTYDRFHKHAHRIHRVVMKIKTADGEKSYATSPASISSILSPDYQNVEGVVTLKHWTGFASKTGENEKAVKIKGFFATPSFFEIFSFGLAAGNHETALSEPNRIVLSQETAVKLFGEEPPLGKVLSLEQAGSFVITGVLKPMPARTSLKLDVLLSYPGLLSNSGEETRNWRNSAFSSYNYVLLRKHELPARLAARLSQIIPLHYAPESSEDVRITAFDLQPLTEIRLGRELANQHEFILPAVIVMAVGMLVLIVTAAACFNYINLTTARALKRAKEIGVRKVVGARRLQLTWQFMIEAMIIASSACVLALPMLNLLIPAFNSLWAVQWTGSQISPHFENELSTYFVAFAFSMLIGLLAGIYPAFFLSSFHETSALRGSANIERASGLPFRKLLVVVQFAFSLVFIVTTLLLYQQSRLMATTDFGFNKEHMLNVALRNVSFELFKQKIEGHPHIVGVSATSLLPATSYQHNLRVWKQTAENHLWITAYSIDYGFFDNMGLKLVAGRNFSPAFATDQDDAIILNETAIRLFGYSSPQEALGQNLMLEEHFSGGKIQTGRPFHIAGVVRDYVFGRLESGIGPLLLYCRPQDFTFANIRLNPVDLAGTLAFIREKWRELDPLHSVDYQFYDDRLEEEYAIYNDAIGVLGLAAGLAILIACLGLLGITAYTVEMRTKEIGIRKVVGAGMLSLVLLLSKDFMRPVVIAIAVATPLAWFLNNLWLEQFATHASFGFGIFGPSILVLLALAGLAIISQTTSAALANPVESLRYE